MSEQTLPPMDLIIDHQKFRKEEEVRENPDDHDLYPTVEVWREGQLVAIVIVPLEGLAMAAKRKFLGILDVIVSGYAADAIILAMDGTSAMFPKNPMTGEVWQAGEMQQLLEQGNKDIITECLIIHIVNRDGEIQFANLHYEVQGTNVHWYDKDEYRERMEKVAAAMGVDLDRAYDEAELDKRFKMHKVSEGEEVGGLIPQGVLQAFQTGTISEHLEKVDAPDFGMDEEEREAHTDAAVTKLLLKRFNLPVMLGLDPDSRHGGIVMESLDAEPNLAKQWWEPEEAI